MEIKITFKKDEVSEIIKAHVLKELPMDVTGKDILVSYVYGDITVEITDNKEKQNEES